MKGFPEDRFLSFLQKNGGDVLDNDGDELCPLLACLLATPPFLFLLLKLEGNAASYGVHVVV
jgi:hypothetical protein